MKPIVLALASGLGLGYAPIAPGTFGTLIGIPLFWVLSAQPWWLYLLSLAALVAFASFAAAVACAHWGESDAPRVVIDEVAGYVTAMFLAPATWQYATAGFVLFRIFDVLKPWPSSYFDQKVSSGFGVVMDDVAAGAYACGALHLLAYLGALAGHPWA
jgi:phosphatidylglycerophosphatase A